ncbi:MAG: hypothetical protein ACI90M_004552, partial [Candidatus Azotimanducaceae bacterium]
MRILQLKAARGWSTTQTANIFAVNEDTVATWLRCIDVLLRALAELTRDDIHPHPGSSRRQLRKVTANKLNIGA